MMEKTGQKYLELNGVIKDFPGVRALDNVEFDVRLGEIHAIVGANGAGKSTLCKILAGIYHMDQGQFLIDGQVVHIENPLGAKERGITMSPQEIDSALIPNLSIGENIMLNQIARQRQQIVNWGDVYKQALEYAAEVGLKINSQDMVGDLSISERQKVIIAQALASRAKFIILDEPTASLSLREVKELFDLLRELIKKHNLSIIYISHRMPEVFEIADRITILRDGKKISTVFTKDTTIDEVVMMMLDKKKASRTRIPRENPPKEDSPVLLKAEGLVHGRLVNHLSFELHKGEIIAIIGLVGAGKTEFARVLFGADRLEEGQLWINDDAFSLSHPSDATRRGIFLVPEDRRRQGVLIEFPIYQNVTLPHLSHFTVNGFIQTGKEKEKANDIIDRLEIKCESNEQIVNYLSGGNQQKVAIGKWLVSPGSVLLFDEPTKGVDVGAKEDIFRIIGNLADQGGGVIYFSSELDEAFRISDRVLVMYDGSIVADLDTEKVTEEELLFYASGGRK
jgi:simple sugar transport system ATP-binding protein